MTIIRSGRAVETGTLADLRHLKAAEGRLGDASLEDLFLDAYRDDG